MRHTFVFIVLLAVPAICSAQTTWYVPDDYLTIQEAIDAAVDGDIVLVAPGTYVENINFLGKAITVKSSDGAEMTVIDGNQTWYGGVAFCTGEGSDSILDGFTITNCAFMGGILISHSSPIITNNIITENSALGLGGGIQCYEYSSATIINNIITSNRAGSESGYGGGIYCGDHSSPVITNNTISGNEVLGRTGPCAGGGICCGFNSSPVITSNIISNNSSGIYCQGSNGSPIIANNHITGNGGCTPANDDPGGGIICFSESSPTIVNNIILGNRSQWGGGSGIICYGSSPSITNSILWDNEGLQIDGGNPSVTYSNVQGGFSGTGNIDSDPLFLDPGFWDDNGTPSDPYDDFWVDGDYHLTFNSPCRGSGDNNAIAEPTDFEGDPRIAYGTVDMGADEFYTHLYFTGDATPGGNVEVKLVGLPGTNPVFLCVGSGVLDTPIPTQYGDWCLDFPLLLILGMGSMVSPEGVSVLPFTFDPGFPAMDIPIQSLIGMELTNLCVMPVE